MLHSRSRGERKIKVARIYPFQSVLYLSACIYLGKRAPPVIESPRVCSSAEETPYRRRRGRQSSRFRVCVCARESCMADGKRNPSTLFRAVSCPLLFVFLFLGLLDPAAVASLHIHELFYHPISARVRGLMYSLFVSRGKVCRNHFLGDLFETANFAACQRVELPKLRFHSCWLKLKKKKNRR